jgi:putative ABC transport system substrate-binding protein
MRRREFITLLSGAAAARPFGARAQQPPVPLIGYLHGQSADAFGFRLAYFRQGLKETGFVEGRNVNIEYRWANNHLEQLPALAADLVRRGVALIVAPDGSSSPLAAKAVTSTVPIVFVMGADPVKLGLIASLARPGGNLTGVTTILLELAGKRLELLCELVPQAKAIGYLFDTRSGNDQYGDTLASARVLGREVIAVEAHDADELDGAFTTLVQRGAQGLLINQGVMFTSNRDKIVALAARYRIPAIYPFRQYVIDGGLVSYGGVDMEGHRLSGLYAGRILRGAKPADLPVEQPTKFEFVINLKTAKALGLDISPAILSVADELVE